MSGSVWSVLRVVLLVLLLVSSCSGDLETVFSGSSNWGQSIAPRALLGSQQQPLIRHAIQPTTQLGEVVGDSPEPAHALEDSARLRDRVPGPGLELCMHNPAEVAEGHALGARTEREGESGHPWLSWFALSTVQIQAASTTEPPQLLLKLVMRQSGRPYTVRPYPELLARESLAGLEERDQRRVSVRHSVTARHCTPLADRTDCWGFCRFGLYLPEFTRGNFGATP